MKVFISQEELWPEYCISNITDYDFEIDLNEKELARIRAAVKEMFSKTKQNKI